MCIIAAKPAGVAMPSQQYIRNMFGYNDDGAGLMYAKDGKVYIEKGFMDEDLFLERLEELERSYNMTELPLVMHFRITTHGGTRPENCHPFPVTDSIGMLKKLRCKTNLAVAHNGIINVNPRSKDISDTMEYIAGQLAPLRRAVPEFYKNKDLLEMVSNAIDSKMVILNGKGEMVFIGNFENDGGVKYSNHSYMYDSSYRSFTYSYDLYSDDIYSGIEYTTKSLMWLNESMGEYVKTSSGEIMQDDFAIDKNGVVYYFDPEVGMFERFPGATAHNFDGGILRFNKDSEYTIKELVLL